jgi:hypothetical protein
MRAFKVEVNSKRICVAGVGTNGVLSATTNCVASPARRGDLFLEVGGLFPETDEHALWAHLKLKVGDRIVLKVIETDSVDKPRERYRFDSKANARNQKAYVLAMVKQFGWLFLTRPRQERK